VKAKSKKALLRVANWLEEAHPWCTNPDCLCTQFPNIAFSIRESVENDEEKLEKK